MSRIFYGGKFYDYPIKLGNASRTSGSIEAFRCGLSFLWVRIRPPKDLSTLEGYIVSNYGWRLYEHFFKTYNEKVWGVSGLGDLRRLGRPAHQGHVAVERGMGADPLLAGRPPPGQVEAGDQPHRGVPVPEVRPGDDVGAVRGTGGRTWAASIAMETSAVTVHVEERRPRSPSPSRSPDGRRADSRCPT